jgi:transcriptional regulator with XRE-family HTH domain
MANVTSVRLRLRELREDEGLSQQALADRAGVRQATISELESGAAQGAKFETLARLAGALGVEPADLFERTSVKRAARRSN